MVCTATILACIVVGYIFIPAIPQGIGTFTSNWIIDASCISIKPKPSCCNMTDLNSSSCGSTFDLKELDADWYRNEIISFLSMSLSIFCTLLGIGCIMKKLDKLWTFTFVLAWIINFIAGFLSFVGCMVIMVKYSGQTPGYSFYLCLPCGPIIWILGTFTIIYELCREKDERRPEEIPLLTDSD